jgi:hypothetical protein
MRKETVVAEFEVLPWHLSGGTEQNHEKPCRGRCPGQDWKWSPPEYKLEVLPLEPACSVALLTHFLSLFIVIYIYIFYSFSGWGETESTWYVGHCWPIVPALDDRWWLWSSWWNEDWQGKPKYSENTYPSATLSTTNPTWPDLGSNPGRRGGKPATNRLSYGTAPYCNISDDGWDRTRHVLNTSPVRYCQIINGDCWDRISDLLNTRIVCCNTNLLLRSSGFDLTVKKVTCLSL